MLAINIKMAYLLMPFELEKLEINRPSFSAIGEELCHL
jgi:hypothetical protein